MFNLFCHTSLADFNLPNVHDAFKEVQNSYYCQNPVWSHPLVVHAKQQMKLPKETYLDVAYFYRFEEIYNEMCWRFMRGEGLCLTKPQGV